MLMRASVRLSGSQRKALLRRARIQGTSLSAQARKAADLYLQFTRYWPDSTHPNADERSQLAPERFWCQGPPADRAEGKRPRTGHIRTLRRTA